MRTTCTIVVLILCGCQAESKPPTAMNQLAAGTGDIAGAQASLFPGDQAVLSNSQIDQILTQKVYPPAHGRIAVVRLGPQAVRGAWSEDVAEMNQRSIDGLLAKLRSSERVSDAMVLPSLLMPAQMTVPNLREAAARLQADTLLVYRTFSQTYETSRWFAADETRAYCTVEALLLDTRTGIVTDTSIATQNYAAHKSHRDINFYETVARAEQSAIAKALDKVGDELLRFLNTAPLPQPPTTRPTTFSATD